MGNKSFACHARSASAREKRPEENLGKHSAGCIITRHLECKAQSSSRLNGQRAKSNKGDAIAITNVGSQRGPKTPACSVSATSGPQAAVCAASNACVGSLRRLRGQPQAAVWAAIRRLCGQPNFPASLENVRSRASLVKNQHRFAKTLAVKHRVGTLCELIKPPMHNSLHGLELAPLLCEEYFQGCDRDLLEVVGKQETADLELPRGQPDVLLPAC